MTVKAATKYRLAVKRGNYRPRFYPKRDLKHAETDLEEYLEPDRFRNMLPVKAWVEVCEMGKWVKVDVDES